MMTVRVQPSGEWWAVEADGLAAPLIFTSGAHAENAARQLATAWAGATGATLEIQPRSGPGYQFLCLPDPDLRSRRLLPIAP